MKKHPYSHTVIEHLKDGSHIVHHIHSQHGYVHGTPERDGDVRGAAHDHDGMVDHIMDNTSEPNEGEDHDEKNEKLEEAIAPGLHEKMAQLQGK